MEPSELKRWYHWYRNVWGWFCFQALLWLRIQESCSHSYPQFDQMFFQILKSSLVGTETQKSSLAISTMMVRLVCKSFIRWFQTRWWFVGWRLMFWNNYLLRCVRRLKYQLRKHPCAWFVVWWCTVESNVRHTKQRTPRWTLDRHIYPKQRTIW
jgi:hypothetical protein